MRRTCKTAIKEYLEENPNMIFNAFILKRKTCNQWTIETIKRNLCELRKIGIIQKSHRSRLNGIYYIRK